MNCYGSIQRAAGMPPGLASDYALDGEEAHELLEYALVNQYWIAYEAKIQAGMEWTHRKDNEEARLQSVQEALDHVQGLIDSYAPDLFVYLECQFTFPTNNNDDAGGTSDVTIFVPDLDMMIIADFKHGSGVAVGAEENSQLMFYAVGSRQELRRNNMCNSGKTIYRMMILQPRAFHREGPMREWQCDDDRLDRFIGEVNFAIDKSKEPMPLIKPGAWCRWCPALAACPEAESYAIETTLPTYHNLEDIRQQGLPTVVDLSVERIGQVLSARKVLDEWLDAIEAQAMALARQGVAIPGHKLVLAQAKSKWYGDERFIANGLAALSGLPPDAFIRPKLVPITEAKTLVKNEIYKRVGKAAAKNEVQAANEAMAVLTIKDTSGNLKLVDRDDKRPEINLAALLNYQPVANGDKDDGDEA